MSFSVKGRRGFGAILRNHRKGTGKQSKGTSEQSKGTRNQSKGTRGQSERTREQSERTREQSKGTSKQSKGTRAQSKGTRSDGLDFGPRSALVTKLHFVMPLSSKLYFATADCRTRPLRSGSHLPNSEASFDFSNAKGAFEGLRSETSKTGEGRGGRHYFFTFLA